MKAHSETLADHPRLSNTPTAIQTGEQTEIDRRSNNELENMTGSFMHTELNRNDVTIEDEYVDHYDGSFVSHKSATS